MAKILFLTALAMILATGFGEDDAKNVDKRHIASLFSSNPFFLSHFGVSHQHYGVPHSYGIWNQDEEDNSEDCEEEPLDFAFPGQNHEEQPEKNEETVTKNTQNNPGVYIFKTLPHFDRFMPFNKVKTVPEVIPNQPEQHQQKSQEVFIFKSLPHYERVTQFAAKPSVAKIEQKPLVVVQSEEIANKSGSRLVDTRIIGSNNENANKVELYFFRSLPLYDIATTFRTSSGITAVPVKKTEGIAKIVSEAENNTRHEQMVNFFNTLPLFESSQLFQKSVPLKKIIEETPKQQNTTNGEVPVKKTEEIATIMTEEPQKKVIDESSTRHEERVNFFNTLPLFEQSQLFQKSVPLTKIIEETSKQQNTSNGEVPVNRTEEIATITTEEPQKKLIDESSTRHEERVNFFNTLPLFESSQMFPKSVALKKILEETPKRQNASRPNEETKQIFTNLPQIQSTKTFKSSTSETKPENHILPFVETNNKFNPRPQIVAIPAVKIEENNTNATNPNPTTQVYFFKSLPNFEVNQNFHVNAAVNDLLTEAIESRRKIAEETARIEENGVRLIQQLFRERIESSEDKPKPISKGIRRKPQKSKGRKVLKAIRKKTVENEEDNRNLEHNIQFLAPHQSKLLKNPEEDVSDYFANGFGRKLRPSGIELLELQENKAGDLMTRKKTVNSYGQFIA